MCADGSLDPSTVLLEDVGWEHELESTLAACAGDGRGEDVWRDLVQRGRQAKDPLRIRLSEGLDVGHVRDPGREAAGQVEE